LIERHLVLKRKTGLYGRRVEREGKTDLEAVWLETRKARRIASSEKPN